MKISSISPFVDIYFHFLWVNKCLRVKLFGPNIVFLFNFLSNCQRLWRYSLLEALKFYLYVWVCNSSWINFCLWCEAGLEVLFLEVLVLFVEKTSFSLLNCFGTFVEIIWLFNRQSISALFIPLTICLLQLAPHCFDYWSFIVNIRPSRVSLPNLFKSFIFPYINFKNNMSVKKKKLTGIQLRLYSIN